MALTPSQSIHRRDFNRFGIASLLALSPGLAAKRKPRVIIGGSGLAGMAAARHLRALGCDVTILEASNRPGGRVHTLRQPFSDGLYAEAGAGRIPKTHDLTLRYVKEFGLTLTPFYPTSPTDLFFLRGKRFLATPKQPLDLSKIGLALTPEEQRLGFSGFEAKYLNKGAAEAAIIPARDWPSPLTRHLDGISIETYMRRQGASDDAIQLSLSGFNPLSALDYLRDLSNHLVPALSKIAGGNDLLPRAFAKLLSGHIRFGAQVVKIEPAPERVRIVYTQAGLQQSIEGDYFLCTIPFSVLRQIEISPAFSDAKQEAIRSLTYGDVSRVYLQTRRRFWKDQNLTGFARVDRYMEVWSPTWDQPGQRGILMNYAFESLSREIAAQSQPERISNLINYYEQVFPGTKENTEFGHSWVWQDQPFARGAYAMHLPGEIYSKLPVARASEGRVLFAGEHCSSQPGWMQGALESGLRAAAEIERAIS